VNQDREFELLVQQYLDGRISPDDMDRLNDRLRSDVAARKDFVEWLNLDSALESAFADGLPRPREKALPRVIRRQRRAAAALAVVAVCSILLMAVAWRQTSRQPFAIVESSVGVRELAQGAALRDAEYRIQAGTLKLRTPLGVQIVVEAPSVFHFESPQRLHLTLGRLSADVPPAARKFTVVTLSGEAVDLGTRFGVDAPLKGDAEVHVLQGEVIARSASGGKRRNLRGGEAFRMQPGAGSSRELRSAAFIQSDEVELLHAALSAGRRVQSDSMLRRLRRDPSLIALLDFEADDVPEGTYNMVQGRWPGSRAPEFAHAGDHMKLDVGGDRGWPQLTLAAWVRLDHLNAPYQSILHTDGWSDNGWKLDESKWGQVHWTVTNRQTMELAMAGNPLLPDSGTETVYPNSKAAALSGQDRWVHLAAVYDADLSTVRFYLDGRLNHIARLQSARPALLGRARVGNWDTVDRKLSGRIDELVILGRAMIDDEVRALYVAGNPYR